MKSFYILFVVVLMTSCLRSNVFEKNVAIRNHQWNENYRPSFTFDITDTLSDYSMSFNMRHTDAYPFSNIWLRIKTAFPGVDTATETKIEVPLADLEGKWLGRGMNEIWEHQMLIASPLRFSKTGTYTITLQQIMRSNPLPEVMSVGIRLEKIKK
jgi:gliding motility-associated lipoprotein GldH